jgi:hypothetical protein
MLIQTCRLAWKVNAVIGRVDDYDQNPCYSKVNYILSHGNLRYNAFHPYSVLGRFENTKLDCIDDEQHPQPTIFDNVQSRGINRKPADKEVGI